MSKCRWALLSSIHLHPDAFIWMETLDKRHNERLSIAESLFVILIGASDAPGGIEWDRVEPVLPSEIELGEADRDSAGRTYASAGRCRRDKREKDET